MTNIQHLLVATDLSERSERAVARALRAAQGGRMTALHVVTAGLPVDLAGRWQKDAEDFLIKRLSGVSSPSSPDIETVVVTGDPFSAIIGEAARRQVDLIVMGEPRRQGYPDMFTGTTAERVIRFSDRPVLMVRREASDPYRRILVAFDGSEGSIRALQRWPWRRKLSSISFTLGAHRMPLSGIRRWHEWPSRRRTTGSGL